MLKKYMLLFMLGVGVSNSADVVVESIDCLYAVNNAADNIEKSLSYIEEEKKFFATMYVNLARANLLFALKECEGESLLKSINDGNKRMDLLQRSAERMKNFEGAFGNAWHLN